MMGESSKTREKLMDRKVPPRQSGLVQDPSVQQGLYSLPKYWQRKCWPSKFQVLVGHYLTEADAGTELGIAEWKSHWAGNQKTMVLLSFRLPTRLFPSTSVRPLTLFCPQLLHLYAMEFEFHMFFAILMLSPSLTFYWLLYFKRSTKMVAAAS